MTWRYLGFSHKSGSSFTFLADLDLPKFYRSTNSIFNTLKKTNEPVLMKLLYSNCVPTLTYGCDVKIFNSKDMQSCNVAINNAIRRIFSFKRWESTRYLREIFDLAKKRFTKSLRIHDNEIMKHLYHVFCTS